MKKQISILSLGLALTGSNLGFSQETKIQPCNTYAAMEQYFAANPSERVAYEARQKNFQAEYEASLNNHRAANRTTAVQYTVPVVFHILHQGGAENVSDSVCIKALAEVNRVYARETVDTASIFTPFKNLYISSDIKFMLAKKDPNGNCTSGIVKHIDDKTNWDQTSASSNASYWPYTWDPTQYLNVYIVANIIPTGTVTGNGIIVGYTYLAGTWGTGNARDAVVYRYNFLSPNAPSYDARSLAHEMGHWLNLAHTFGNTNNPGVSCGSSSGGDGVSDTPDTKGSFGNCPQSSTNTAYTCTSPDPNYSSGNVYYQNVQNIMDYSGCPRNFTAGQTARMRATLSGTNNLGGRNNVWSTTNLNFTDVNGAGLCTPISQFLSANNSYTICSGGSLNMKDVSYNGIITSWQWSADNGATIAAPSASNTAVTFNTPGSTNVTLQVSNAQGTTSYVRNVTVLDGTPIINSTYMESFENGGQGLPADWTTYSAPVGTTIWQQTYNAALDGSYSYFVDGTNTNAGQSGWLQMPVMDLLNNQNCVFSFEYAYAQETASQDDLFKVQLSSDCGASWTDVVILGAYQMQLNSGGVTSAPYIPTSTSEWKKVVVSNGNYPNWSLFTNSPSVIARFNFTEGSTSNGNDFYLDVINFDIPTGINELTKSIKLTMYPNPSTGATNLDFSLSGSSSVKINVVDVLGKEVLPAEDYSFGSGNHVVAINKNQSLSQGVYFVNMSLNGAKMSKKLIIN